MTYRRKLIEVALPLQAINEASARERLARRRHPRTLHPWPNRRPLAECRAVVFAAIVDDPDSPDAPRDFVDACLSLPRGRNAAQNDTPRQRLLDFVERLVRWESSTDDQILRTARDLIRLATGGNPPPLHDPFAGGGSIPLEAQRLGLEAHASDLDPVAVILCRALIEIPSRFSGRPSVNPSDRAIAAKGAAGLAADVHYYGRWMRDRAWERIGHLYPEYVPPAWGLPQRVMSWIWARTVDCPNADCRAQVPLVTSFWLCRKKGRHAWVAPHIDTHSARVSFDVARGNGGPMDLPKGGRGAKFRCFVCGASVDGEYLVDEGSSGRLGAQLLAVATEGPNGPDYFAPLHAHEGAANVRDALGVPVRQASDSDTDLPPRLAETIAPRELHSPRQWIALTTLSDLVAEVQDPIRTDALEAGLPPNDVPLREGGAGARAYGEAVATYLAIGLSQQASQLTTLCSWDARSEDVRETVARQPATLPWDYAEANPFAASSASYLSQLEDVCRALEDLNSSNLGRATLRDATRFGYRRRYAFSTDPPYYDRARNTELSDSAYTWLRRSLRSVYPKELASPLVPPEVYLVATPPPLAGADGGTPSDPFAEALERAFVLIRGGADSDYPLTAFCAYREAEDGVVSVGWETMLEGLVQAGFTIVGTWPIRSKQTRHLRKRPIPSAPEVVLVCRPRPRHAPRISRHEFASALRRELPCALREVLSNNVAPVDLAQSSLGPGLAVYSRYSAVVEPDGGVLSLRDALSMINQALDAFLIVQDGFVDNASRFAIAWFDRFGYTVRSVDEATTLARMKDTSIAQVLDAGILRSRGSRAWLVRWQDLESGWDRALERQPLVWKATHHLIRRLNGGGQRDAATFLARIPADLAQETRQLAYRLYSICDRQGWVEEARAYGNLIDSWGEIQVNEEDSTGLLHQRRLFE